MSETIDTAKEGIEHAHHAREHESDPHATRTAVLIAALAAALALAEMGEKQNQNAYLTHHISVSDDWNFFQAKSVRATMRTAEAEILDALPGAGSDATRAAAQKARDEAARLRDDPTSGEGAKQLAERAQHQTEQRDHAFHQYHLFELVVGALQIAIVLASVSVVTRVRTLAIVAGALGAIAAACGVAVALEAF
jgi:hypothetical protein